MGFLCECNCCKEIDIWGMSQSLNNKLRYVLCVTVESGKKLFFGRIMRSTFLTKMFTTNFDI